MPQRNKIVIVVCLFLVAGCSLLDRVAENAVERDNSITLSNGAGSAVLFNFRGELYPVPAASTVVIDKIPVGTYQYATLYPVVPGYKAASSNADSSSGTFFFPDNKTQYAVYIDMILQSSDSSVTYVFNSTNNMALPAAANPAQ